MTSDGGDRKTPQKTQSSREVGDFLAKVARTPVVAGGTPPGRLLFAMDATASREASWDTACHLQAQMFTATENVGNLSVQLCYYRGFNEFRASSWCNNPTDLLAEMSSVRCLGGHTQIKRVLDHTQAEHKRNPIKAVVFVGDAIEEDGDTLCHLAGQLGVLNIPLFMFQEGHLPGVRSIFQQMAHLSGGAFAPFDRNSASELKDLLSAVAVFAAGGTRALENFSSARKGEVARLTQQIRKS